MVLDVFGFEEMASAITNNVIEIEHAPKSFIYDDCKWNIMSTLNMYDLTYETFFQEYMMKNLPCIVKNVSNSWECSSKWITKNSINVEHFIDEYGYLVAPIADCNLINFNSQCKMDMTVCDYIKYLTDNRRERLLYLKDWHLRRARPKDNFYEVPMIFASDWLNEYAQDKADDDFMFVYIGPKDTWTPLHVDVYSSYSWSVNVIGRKQWFFFPPGEEYKLKDPFGNLPLTFDPNIHKNIKFFQVMQEKGDAIFVPSGWYHQVTNLLDTISINHNWINGCNIHLVWKAIQECLKSVEHEIEQFKDSSEYVMQCQTILKSLFGMDYDSFITFLCHIAKKRLQQLAGENYLIFQKYLLGIKQIHFDLSSILIIMNSITDTQKFFKKYSLIHLEENFFVLRSKITEKLLENTPPLF